MASRWQHNVRFDRPETWTLNLPLQRRTGYHSNNWPFNHITFLKILFTVANSLGAILWLFCFVWPAHKTIPRLIRSTTAKPLTQRIIKEAINRQPSAVPSCMVMECPLFEWCKKGHFFSRVPQPNRGSMKQQFICSTSILSFVLETAR